ncbi:MAG: type I restriction endonuclease subunit R, partial [Sutterella sp.]|nr:type I restriction endonuclease subunit R [Sutterella sp.]
MKVGYCESEYEAATLDLLEAEGWLRSSGDELHRKYSEAILEEDLNAFLSRRHPDFTEQERSRVVFNLRNTSSNTDYLSLRSVGQLCLNGFVFDRDDTSLPSCQVDYIDFEKPNQNIFRAVSQLTIREMGAERRPDILLYVNGIPLCIIELKNPAQRQASISSAWEQIHIRYKRDIPSLMKFCLLSVISDGGNTRLGTTCAPFEHYYAWKKVENEENAASGLGELQSLIKGALAPGRFLEIVRDFVYFPDVQEGQQQELEIVCR